MNQVKDSLSGVNVHPVPLFASSWVALFTLLRSNFVKGRHETSADIKDDDVSTGSAQH
jgi:hypothetical protein